MAIQDKHNKHLIKTVIKDEKFLRSSLVFLVFYIFILLQKWRSILFLLVPLITYVLFVFFKGIDILKNRTQVQQFNIKFNPIGNEKIIASRLYFCLLLEIIIVFAMGAESLYHPQLIGDYFIYYVIPLILIYIFSMYYPLYDLGFYAKIEIELKNELNSGSETEFEVNSSDRITDSEDIDSDNENSSMRKKELLTYLNFKKFGSISTMTRICFVILAIGWLLFQMLTILNFFPGIPVYIPGSVIPQGSPLYISYFVYVCIIAVPIIIYIVINRTHSVISGLDFEELKKIISKFPEHQQQKIIRTLKFHLNFKEI